jgi:large subunit ribosomal protein L7/L12
MKKDEKLAVVAELHEKFERAKLVVMTECWGLPVNEITELRRQLRSAKAEFKVVKNTLAMRAVEGTSLAGVKPLLKGPMACVLGYDDPVLAAKTLRDFIKGEKREAKITIKGGVLDGQLVHPSEIAALANLPSRPTLLAMLVTAFQAPLRGLVYTLHGVLAQVVRVLAAILEAKKGDSAMSATQSKVSKDELIAAIESMSVLELSELVKSLEARFGVTAATPVAVAAVPQAASGAAAPVEEKTAFDVMLVSVPAEKKIQIIKVVRELTNLGLKEAKDLVEGVPKPVKTGIAKDEAEAMKKKLEESGAKVEIK